MLLWCISAPSAARLRLALKCSHWATWHKPHFRLSHCLGLFPALPSKTPFCILSTSWFLEVQVLYLSWASPSERGDPAHFLWAQAIGTQCLQGWWSSWWSRVHGTALPAPPEGEGKGGHHGTGMLEGTYPAQTRKGTMFFFPSSSPFTEQPSLLGVLSQDPGHIQQISVFFKQKVLSTTQMLCLCQVLQPLRVRIQPVIFFQIF